MLRTISVLSLMLLCAGAGSAQAVPESEGWAGCYVLELGEWAPPITERNEPFHTPPDTLRLIAEVGPEEGGSPFEAGRSLVRPIIDRGLTPSAFWSREDSGAVRIVWTNGFAGVRLNLKADEHASLTGVAEAFTDFVGPPPRPRTEATLWRIGCVDDRPDSTLDLTSPVRHASEPGQTYLRTLLLAQDHAAYHIGQIVQVRRLVEG